MIHHKEWIHYVRWLAKKTLRRIFEKTKFRAFETSK